MELKCMDPIFQRVSVRQFIKEKKVEREKTERLLHAAMAAPSSTNQQPWEFYVTEDREVLERLSRCSPYAGCAKNAPAVIVTAYRNNCRLPEFAPMDLSLAMQNLWLEAEMLGLGGVWLAVAPYEERMKKVEEVLKMPEELRAFAIFAYGYPAKKGIQQNRFDETRIHYVIP